MSLKTKIKLSASEASGKIVWELEVAEPVGVLTAKQQEELFVQMQRMRQIVTKECERLRSERKDKNVRKSFATKHGRVYSEE